METIAQEAKRLLEPIPEKRWITNNFGSAGACFCFIGHWNILHGKKMDDTFETMRWIEHSRSFQLKEFGKVLENFIFLVNDGNHPEYMGKSPKRRVMELLDDMIKAGY